MRQTSIATPPSARHPSSAKPHPGAGRSSSRLASLGAAVGPAAVALLLYGLLLFHSWPVTFQSERADYDRRSVRRQPLLDLFDDRSTRYRVGWPVLLLLAHDPLLRSTDPAAFLDHPAYRYGRVLYPALAWLGALGQPAAMAWSIARAEPAGHSGRTVASSYILCALNPAWDSGPRRWLALAFAFSPAVLLGHDRRPG